MKFVQMVQNSEEWLALRKTKLGASDANIVMGMSEYKTRRELWLEKTNQAPKEEEKKNTFATDKGHRIEPKIRAMAEIKYDCELEAVICLSESYPDFMASLDGYGVARDEISYVLECKYVGQEDFEKVKSGEILPQYKPQMMMQLMLTGANKIILGVATENKEDLDEKGKPRLKYADAVFTADIAYIRDELLPALRKFWSCVETKVDVGYSYDDVMIDDGNEYLSDALTRYELVEKELAEVTERAEKIKKEVFKLAKHDKVVCNGIKVYTVKTKGKTSTNYDYESYLKDSGLELPAKYITSKTGKPSTSYQIKWPEKVEEKSPEEMIVKGASINVEASGEAIADAVKTEADKEVITSPETKKRTRRTKAQIEADKLAASQK